MGARVNDIFKPMSKDLIKRFKEECPPMDDFDGQIADLIMWETALSPEQIRQLSEPAVNPTATEIRMTL